MKKKNRVQTNEIKYIQNKTGFSALSSDAIAIYRIWNVARSELIHFWDEPIKENNTERIWLVFQKHSALLLHY